MLESFVFAFLEGRWPKFTYNEVAGRYKTSLDISWIKDKSLTDLDNLPDWDALANEVIENLKAGVDGFEKIMLSINSKP
jgi:type I restriction enzyme M protein